jgi:hypothetical protein
MGKKNKQVASRTTKKMRRGREESSLHSYSLTSESDESNPEIHTSLP